MGSPTVFICVHVLRKDRPPRVVVHHTDGQWQITCGERGHGLFRNRIKAVHIEHVINDMAFLADLVPKLLAGQKAEMIEGEWVISLERG